jgi:hypothetical protein
MAVRMGARTSGFRAGSRKVASAIVVAVFASLVVVSSASATVDFRDRYSFDYAFTYPCGSVEISVVGHAAGTAHIRVGTGKFDTAFFAHDNYSFRETHTNPDGDFLVISGDGLFQETRAVPLGGNLFQFSSHNSGRPFIVTDENGDVVVRDRGTIRETIIFDTTGDNLPGGHFIAEVSFEVAGPHDGLGFDTCDILG